MNQQQSTTAPSWANASLQPGQQYTAQQLWGQKAREVHSQGPDMEEVLAAKMKEVLAAKQREREALVFPFKPPTEGSPGSFTFQPMSGGPSPFGGDDSFTPLGGSMAAPSVFPVPTGSYSIPLQAQGADHQVLRLLLSQARQSVQDANNHLLAIETLLASQSK